MDITTQTQSKYPTPYYYYDTDLLQQTLDTLRTEAARHENYHVHYAVKANANPRLLRQIRQAGLGADCVSGGEIERAVEAGFAPDSIVFAGVGKSDQEIELALQHDILCFNIESAPELEVIEQLAARAGKSARVCLRINPDIGAHTHAHITTGRAENKFGIALEDMDAVLDRALALPHIQLLGLHFHIGSQLLVMDDYVALCQRVNEIQDRLDARHISLRIINVGGGLGIDYDHPTSPEGRIPDFRTYFDTFEQHLHVRPGQEVHFELGRAVVGQCGTLVTRVLYVKTGRVKQFAIVDAGFTELIRPALYGAYHHIDNLTSTAATTEPYDIVGPICESSDVFATERTLPHTSRGDLLAIRSAGAYGETMASQYNCRPLVATHTQEDF